MANKRATTPQRACPTRPSHATDWQGIMYSAPGSAFIVDIYPQGQICHALWLRHLQGSGSSPSTEADNQQGITASSPATSTPHLHVSMPASSCQGERELPAAHQDGPTEKQTAHMQSAQDQIVWQDAWRSRNAEAQGSPGTLHSTDCRIISTCCIAVQAPLADVRSEGG